MDPDARILGWFSNIAANSYGITSPRDPFYNCIAWAANDIYKWWWPGKYGYWPPTATKAETVDAFVSAFATLGFIQCANGDLIADVEKLALYVDQDGKPTHMARQLSSGKWTSKLGKWEDIEHDTVDSLTGDDPAYGRIAVFFQRERRPTIAPH